MLGIRWHCSPSDSPSGEWMYSDNYSKCREGKICETLPKYCSDWNATMPLAIENYISLIDGYSEYYFACDRFSDGANCEGGGISYDIYSEDKDPLRAIVICLIKVLESHQ